MLGREKLFPSPEIRRQVSATVKYHSFSLNIFYNSIIL